MQVKPSSKMIGLLSLIMLITGSIDSIRNLPATALFGSQLIAFFVISAIVFLIPVGLVSAELANLKTKYTGIYGWVREAFGEQWAMLAIWLQWINTMVWYPTILSFIAATAVFLFMPELAQQKLYQIITIITVFWGLTLVNLRGIQTSARFASFCAIVGMVIPMFLIISLAVAWFVMGNPIHIQLTWASIAPRLHDQASLSSLTAIMTAFLGIELATAHVKRVQNAQRTFPLAIAISVIFILLTMILGSLAIAIVLPQANINLVDGVIQAFDNFVKAYHMSFLTPVITVMILIGSLGGMVNWLISPAEGLLQAANDKFLPPYFTKVNQHGVASRLLIGQAVLVTLFCSAYLFMPSVNSSYWLLTALSTQLYIFMYVLMFAAAITLKFRSNSEHNGFKIPFGKKGTVVVSTLGFVGCIVTLIVGFFPPQSIDVGGQAFFDIVFGVSMVVMVLPVFGLYLYRARNKALPSQNVPLDSIEAM